MSFSKVLISTLGEPVRPFSWIDAALVIAMLAGAIGLELLIGSALRKIARRLWSRVVTQYRKANKL